MLYNSHFQYRTIEDFVKEELIKEAQKELLSHQVYLDSLIYCEKNKKMISTFKDKKGNLIQYYCYCQQTSDSYKYVYTLVNEHNKNLKDFNSPLVAFVKVSTDDEKRLLKEYQNSKKGIFDNLKISSTQSPLFNILSQ